LLVKQGFVAGLLVIAAINLLVISPQLRQDRLQGISNSNLVARFGKILIVELTFAGLLLASVSFLTYIPPAKLPALSTDLVESATVDDLKIDISISPGRIGQNTFVLRLSANREHVHTAKEVLLRFTPDQANIPPSELELIAQGDGTFQAKGTYLSVPGDWQVQAVVRRENKFDAFANFNFTLQKPGTASESLASTFRQSGLLLLGVGLLCAVLAFSINVKPGLRLGTWIPATFLLVGLGIFYLLRPIPLGIDRANPIPPNAESLAAGQVLFTAKCAPCHGQSGLGDGPIGVGLNPRPADLRQHAIPGIHTDAQLFEWIINGFPGSQMPAFRATLSDTDRWNLVNFIRTLAPE
jgi:mono/diheme cytochrome c family protein